MKVLAFNGSPRGKNSNTEFLIKHFLKGAKDEGSETETVYLNEKNIKYCHGCFTCWTKTPGKCIYRDDMDELLNKICTADIIVYGTPLYYFTFSGLMKNFIDRMLPLVKEKIVNTDNGYSHNSRIDRIQKTKSVLISNCGFPGNENFSGLLETFKVWHRNSEIAGSILINQGGVLNIIEHNEYLTNLYSPFIKALQNAGKEVATLGQITLDTQKLLDKQYMATEVYVKNANQNWN